MDMDQSLNIDVFLLFLNNFAGWFQVSHLCIISFEDGLQSRMNNSPIQLILRHILFNNNKNHSYTLVTSVKPTHGG